MAELVKSTVKCYKKKTKKTVGGERKTYEYNQYQVPLKKSDNLACSDEVFIVPRDQFEDIIASEIEGHKQDLRQHKGAISEFQKDLADLEWKHGELSRSYKVLVSKNAKTNKKLRLETEKNTTLEEENQKLKTQMQKLYKEYKDLKDTHISKLEKIELPEDENLKKDPDFWTSIRSRFSSKEIKDHEDGD